MCSAVRSVHSRRRNPRAAWTASTPASSRSRSPTENSSAAERDVVQERSSADATEVDQPFHAVREGAERGERIVPVDSDVRDEVVSGPPWDADEREVPVSRHVGNDRE